MKNFLSKIQIAIFILFLVILLEPLDSYANSPIRIKNVKKIPLDEIGILTYENGGLKTQIWHQGNRSFIETMITNIPIENNSAVIGKLRRLILLTKATHPSSKRSIVSSVFNIKLKILAKLGEYQDLNKMINQVPQKRVTEHMHKIYISSYFIADKYKQACAISKSYLKHNASMFWREAQIICNAFYNKQDNVSFNLKLLKEDGHELSDKHKEIVKLFSSKQTQKAKDTWESLLNEKILQLPKIMNNFPSLKNVAHSKLDRDIINQWLKKNHDIPTDEKLRKTVSLFAKMEAVGDKITLNQWRQFIKYSISNNLPIDNYAAYRLLEQTQSAGEKILIIIHILNRLDINKTPEYLLTSIITNLNKMGFEKEAKHIAEQGIDNG